MYRRLLGVLPLVLLLLACSTEKKPDLSVLSNDTVVDLPDGYGRVEGQIKANGRVVARTRVQMAVEGSNNAIAVETDSNGFFAFPKVPEGKNIALVMTLRCRQYVFPAEAANSDCSKHTILRRIDVLPGRLTRIALNVDCALCDGPY
jgi:hypothetical protein